MQRLVFSTDSVPAREQFEFWRELGERHLLAVSWHRDGPSGAPFRGSMAVQQLGGARFVDLRCEGHRAVPGRAAAVRAAADVCLIEQEIAGPAQYVIGDRSLACRPGDLLVHAPDARFEQDGPDDWATRIWVVPRRWLFPCSRPAAALPSTSRGATGRRSSPRARRRRWRRRRTGWASRRWPRPSWTASAACSRSRPARRPARSRAAARRCARRRWSGPDATSTGTWPTPGWTRRARRTPSGSQSGSSSACSSGPARASAGYVTRRRLEEVRAALARHAARPVTDLALAWGFGSLPSFYRAFRHAYGASPGELRAASTIGGKRDAIGGG